MRTEKCYDGRRYSACGIVSAQARFEVDNHVPEGANYKIPAILEPSAQGSPLMRAVFGLPAGLIGRTEESH